MTRIKGQIIDIEKREIFSGYITFDKDSGIQKIEKADHDSNQYILPGFIDAHIHIESSMLTPAEFARIAVIHGTVATVSDPHEIANVLGLKGVKYMIENGKKVNFKFHFGAPSCVPATSFETAGDVISPDNIEDLFRNYPVKYLAEMMNWPGVLNNDPLVTVKIELAKKYGLPVDGHAPGLKGEKAVQYINAGISTDHECYQLDEAIHKLKNGMKILIREGSAARNFNELFPLINQYANDLMFCSDDKHPDELILGHINELVKRAVSMGADVFDVLKIACVNPVHHYHLDSGLLKVGDPADFIVIEDLKNFKVQQTYINGSLVAENGKSFIPRINSEIINHFQTSKKSPQDFNYSNQSLEIPVIVAKDQELITEKIYVKVDRDAEGFIQPNIENDILKIAVVNRYAEERPAVSFIKNIGIKKGAIASSVAHDSHNIIVVGTGNEAITKVVNLIIEHKGGIAAVDNDREMILPLPVAGLMSVDDGFEVAETYKTLDQMAKSMGSFLSSPFMTLSFMALLVIPELKLSDKGLFDGINFDFV